MGENRQFRGWTSWSVNTQDGQEWTGMEMSDVIPVAEQSRGR